MWPWGHAAVAVLTFWTLVRARALLRAYPRLRDRALGRDRERARANVADATDAVPGMGRSAIVAVLLGSQVPDLVDKPLAWGVPLLPTGRSLGHSLLVAVPVIVAVLVLARRRNRGLAGVAFAVGYVTGILTDVPSGVFEGDFSRATFLVWPLLPLPSYDLEPSFVAHLTAFEVTGGFLFQTALGLGVAALVLWEYRRADPGS